MPKKTPLERWVEVYRSYWPKSKEGKAALELVFERRLSRYPVKMIWEAVKTEKANHANDWEPNINRIVSHIWSKQQSIDQREDELRYQKAVRDGTLNSFRWRFER